MTHWLEAILADPRWTQPGTFVVNNIVVSRAPHEVT